MFSLELPIPEDNPYSIVERRDVQMASELFCCHGYLLILWAFSVSGSSVKCFTWQTAFVIQIIKFLGMNDVLHPLGIRALVTCHTTTINLSHYFVTGPILSTFRYNCFAKISQFVFLKLNIFLNGTYFGITGGMSWIIIRRCWDVGTELRTCFVYILGTLVLTKSRSKL